jgi:uncharacterized protein
MSPITQSSGRVITLFFLLTFALSWAIWVPAMTESFGWPGYSIPGFPLLGAVMPGVAATILAAIMGGRKGVGTLWRKVKVWRVDGKWYGVAVFLRPAIVIAAFLGLSAWQGSLLPSTEFSIAALITMLLIQTPNTLLEEVGWRGFALPRMAEKWGWLPAALLLGAIHGAWHLPYWLSQTDIHVYGALAIAMWYLMVLVATPLFVWLYRTTQSVLVCWLLHLSTNTILAFLPLSSASMGSLWPLAVDILIVGGIAVVACRSLLKADRASRAAGTGRIEPGRIAAVQPGSV